MVALCGDVMPICPLGGVALRLAVELARSTSVNLIFVFFFKEERAPTKKMTPHTKQPRMLRRGIVHGVLELDCEEFHDIRTLHDTTSFLMAGT